MKIGDGQLRRGAEMRTRLVRVARSDEKPARASKMDSLGLPLDLALVSEHGRVIRGSQRRNSQTMSNQGDDATSEHRPTTRFKDQEAASLIEDSHGRYRTVAK